MLQPERSAECGMRNSQSAGVNIGTLRVCGGKAAQQRPQSKTLPRPSCASFFREILERARYSGAIRGLPLARTSPPSRYFYQG